MKFHVLLTISSGDKIPNCTRFTVRSGAFESLIAILAQYFVNYSPKFETHKNKVKSRGWSLPPPMTDTHADFFSFATRFTTLRSI